MLKRVTDGRTDGRTWTIKRYIPFFAMRGDKKWQVNPYIYSCLHLLLIIIIVYFFVFHTVTMISSYMCIHGQRKCHKKENMRYDCLRRLKNLNRLKENRYIYCCDNFKIYLTGYNIIQSNCRRWQSPTNVIQCK